MSKEHPIRRCHLKLDLQADSREDLIDRIQRIAREFELEGISMTCVSAGYRDSYHYSFIEHEEITGDSFREALRTARAREKNGNG